jgi:Ankyrin repeats (3 copies)
VKAFIGDTLEHVKSSRAAHLSPAVVQRASVMQELVNTQPLLHCCVSEPSSRLDGKDPGQGRLEVARYLLGLKNNMINLNVTDDDGRTALHLAAKKEDSAILGVLLAARDESSERKAQLDINSRCGKSGWTILHYAAGQGDVTAVRMLMNAGATLVVHSTVGKAVTPLDLVKTRLQNAGHFSAAHIANLQQVAKEISEGVRALEKVKHQKEAERLLKEEKLEAARKKQAEREEKERELLERKQKQLKEKQERDRNRDVEVKTVSSTTTQSSSLSSTSRSMSHNSNVTGGLTPQSLLSTTTSPSPSFTPPSSSNTSVCNASIDQSEAVDGLKSAKKKKKRDKKTESEVPLPPSINESEKVTVVDVASRDEMLNHLLAMGFAEVDCFSAITLFGKDLDRALSWLCDRPAKTSESDSTSVSVRSITSSTHTHTTSGSTVTSSAADSVTQLAEANRLQKEKDHKEELRRVNRAWNIKAEDEKKKVTADLRVIFSLDFIIFSVKYSASVLLVFQCIWKVLRNRYDRTMSSYCDIIPCHFIILSY